LHRRWIKFFYQTSVRLKWHFDRKIHRPLPDFSHFPNFLYSLRQHPHYFFPQELSTGVNNLQSQCLTPVFTIP
jgi:hypothetical protein